MKRIMIVLSLLAIFSCEDKFHREKYDIQYVFINKTNSVIPELKINAADGVKVWIIKNLEPGKTEKLKFNIKRDLKISEGGFVISALLVGGDSLSLNTGYFTNWYYQGPNPSNFNIYEDKIVMSN